ncbi:hypothetical protein BS78_03G168300 [Paspalum vaginatum]|nr:hypothetical protein BS78_03G168300 [Paspalum vaginatum]
MCTSYRKRRFSIEWIGSDHRWSLCTNGDARSEMRGPVTTASRWRVAPSSTIVWMLQYH